MLHLHQREEGAGEARKALPKAKIIELLASEGRLIKPELAKLCHARLREIQVRLGTIEGQRSIE